MKAARRTFAVLAVLLLAPLCLAAQDDPGTHRVRRGDTLWDLAARYLSSPYRWSEIYDLNPGIVEDPHWIYPGELLRLPGIDRPESGEGRATGRRVVGVAGVTAGQASGQERHGHQASPSGEYPEGSIFRQDNREGGLGTLSVAEAEPRPIVSMSDFYGASLLTDPATYSLAGITGRVVVENPLGLKLPSAARPYDEVILHMESGGAEVGDDLLGVRWDRTVSGEGRVLLSMAHVRVTRAYGDSVRAEVLSVFGDYQVGDPIVIPEPFTVRPGVRPEPEDAGPVGKVIAFEVDQTLIGTGERLFINLGSVDGVQAGDDFAIFPLSEGSPAVARLEDRVGTARVVRTGYDSSTARVIELRDPGMKPGAAVRRIGRMPR